MFIPIVPSNAETIMVRRSGIIPRPALIGDRLTAVWCSGAGGGGGGGNYSTGSGKHPGGGGGGGGATMFYVCETRDLPATMSCVVGAGGAGGSASTGTTAGSAGTDGGLSSITDSKTGRVYARAYGGGAAGGAKNINDSLTWVNGGGGGGLTGAASGFTGGTPADYETVGSTFAGHAILGGGWSQSSDYTKAAIAAGSIYGGAAGQGSSAYATTYGAGLSQFGGGGGELGYAYTYSAGAWRLPSIYDGRDCVPFSCGAEGGQWGELAGDYEVPAGARAGNGGLGGGGGAGGLTVISSYGFAPFKGGKGGDGLIALATWEVERSIFDKPGIFTWSKPDWVRFVYVVLISAGGGGNGNYGGGGARREGFFLAELLPHDVLVEVGKGGYGALNGVAANDGGRCRFHTLLQEGGKGAGISTNNGLGAIAVPGFAGGGGTSTTLRSSIFGASSGDGSLFVTSLRLSPSNTIWAGLGGNTGSSASFSQDYPGDGYPGATPGGGGGKMGNSYLYGYGTAVGGRGGDGVVRIYCW